MTDASTQNAPADDDIDEDIKENLNSAVDEPAQAVDAEGKRRIFGGHAVVFVIAPLLLMVMAIGAGYLKYQENSATDSRTAAISSMQAATEGAVALLSYTPDTVEAKLTASRDLLTGDFRNAYTSLTNDVVIPGAKQKQITATATVPGVASVSASENHAVVLVFVDQSVVIGNDAPTQTASAVQVTLEKSGNHWLISGFDPK